MQANCFTYAQDFHTINQNNARSLEVEIFRKTVIKMQLTPNPAIDLNNKLHQNFVNQSYQKERVYLPTSFNQTQKVLDSLSCLN